MEKYKICPSCHTKNAPNLFECVNCEADLTGVKITDEEKEEALRSLTGSEPTKQARMIRLCECGTKNPPNTRKCSACGESIIDISPTEDTEEKKSDEVVCVLSSLDGKCAYKISDGKLTVGRENVMSDYLSSKSYVSRMHAIITLQDGRLFIENVSKTKNTYVNNRMIESVTELLDGDEIGLGGTSVDGNRQSNAAYFLVRIGSCT